MLQGIPECLRKYLQKVLVDGNSRTPYLMFALQNNLETLHMVG